MLKVTGLERSSPEMLKLGRSGLMHGDSVSKETLIQLSSQSKCVCVFSCACSVCSHIRVGTFLLTYVSSAMCALVFVLSCLCSISVCALACIQFYVCCRCVCCHPVLSYTCALICLLACVLSLMCVCALKCGSWRTHPFSSI